MLGRRLVAASVLLSLACGGKSPTAECAPGYLRDGSGTCVLICIRQSDCGACEDCVDGLCQHMDVCDPDPCAACGQGQVCYDDICMPACDPVDGSCVNGRQCVQVEGVEFCAPVSGFTVGGSNWGGVQTSAGGAFVVRGAVVPWGGAISGGSYVIRDASH